MSDVIADDGVRLWSCVSGSGVPLILCHGGPGLWDEGAPIAHMVDDVATVIRWDQRGAGRSETTGPYTIARFVADLDAVRSAHGVERAVIAGHSWGAGLALRYCLRHPHRALGLIYISGTDLGWRHHHNRYRQARLDRLGPHRGRWEQLRATAPRTAEEDRELNLLTWSTDYADRGHALEFAEQWGWTRYSVNYEANAAVSAELETEDDKELRDRCRGLRVPTAVIHGADDPRPIDGPRALAATLPAAQFIELAGVGHVPWAEKPHLLRDPLRSFVATVAR